MNELICGVIMIIIGIILIIFSVLIMPAFEKKNTKEYGTIIVDNNGELYISLNEANLEQIAREKYVIFKVSRK